MIFTYLEKINKWNEMMSNGLDNFTGVRLVMLLVHSACNKKLPNEVLSKGNQIRNDTIFSIYNYWYIFYIKKFEYDKITITKTYGIKHRIIVTKLIEFFFLSILSSFSNFVGFFIYTIQRDIWNEIIHPKNNYIYSAAHYSSPGSDENGSDENGSAKKSFKNSAGLGIEPGSLI